MKTSSLLAAVALLGVSAASAQAQLPDLAGLLDGLGGLDGLQQDTGTTPTTPPSTGGGNSGGPVFDTPIPQENLRAFRDRAPSILTRDARARYRERTSNLGNVGPATDLPMPDVPQQPRVLPQIANDLIGSVFDFVNQFINGLNLLTAIQSGTLGAGGSGTSFDALLQQFLNSQNAKGTGVESDVAAEAKPEPSTSVIVPFVPPAG